MIYNLFIIGIGGFLGTICRVLIIFMINKFFPHNLNYATLIVNIIGSFLIGILFSYAEVKNLNILTKIFFSLGFLGAFTTFSAFSYENLLFLQSGNYFHFILNIFLNLSLCTIAVWLGYLIFK